MRVQDGQGESVEASLAANARLVPTIGRVTRDKEDSDILRITLRLEMRDVLVAEKEAWNRCFQRVLAKRADAIDCAFQSGTSSLEVTGTEKDLERAIGVVQESVRAANEAYEVQRVEDARRREREAAAAAEQATDLDAVRERLSRFLSSRRP